MGCGGRGGIVGGLGGGCRLVEEMMGGRAFGGGEVSLPIVGS